MPARNLSLLEVVKELHSVVGSFPLAWSLENANTGLSLALSDGLCCLITATSLQCHNNNN